MKNLHTFILNGYDFNSDFENYLKTIGDPTSLEDFGLFLTETIGKIGDRHSSMSSIRGFDLNESLFYHLSTHHKMIKWSF